MQTRLKGLQRVAVVYMAMKHAQAQAVEQAAAALREAELLIERQRAQVKRSSLEGRVALDAGDHVDWQMHESQKEFTEWNAEGLLGLRERREASMLQAVADYRAADMQLEQMENVLRELRSKLEVERSHVDQREADDRFLARRWWDARSGVSTGARGDHLHRVHEE